LLDTIILKPDEYLKHIVFPVNNVEKKEFYKLSSVQRMTYVFQMLDYEGSNRNISRALLLEGEIDIIKLKESFKKLIKRHESLRTSFEVKEGGPIQIVHQCFDFDFEYYHIPNRDRNDLPMPKIEEIFDGFIRTFDLTKAPIMRGGLIKLENFKYILLVDLHQIICDDISLDIFFKELFEIYEKGEMSKLRLQYKDYVEGQNDSIWKQILKEQEEYWLKEFADEFPVLNLPIDYSRPPLASHNLGYLNFVLNKDETKRLTSLSSNEDVTLYMLLSAILNILLWRLSGSESIVIGMMNERRVQMELLNVIGQFSNWIAIRSSPCRGKSFKEFLKEIKCCILNALLNSDYPYEELVDRLPIKRDISRNPLFDVVFTLEDGNWKLDDIKILKISKIDLRSLKYGANFDLNINGLQIGDTLAFTVKFNADLFKKQTIESFIGYFRNLISSISRNKDQDISEIDIMTEKEKNQMLFNFNDTQSEYPKDKTLPELFGDQVKKSPNSLSVVSMDNQLTYKELNSRANQLGFLLRSKGIKTDHLVGIMLYKSIEMIVGIYSILKAGGAYLPIDPAHPQIRKSYVLADSGAEIILSNKEYLIKNELELQAISLKSIFALDVESSYSGEKSNMEIVNRPSDLAYMIYTSGSTGKPKGILIEHRNVVNLIFGLNERIYKKYKERLKISWISSFAFDASVKQIFAALILGHSLYIVPDAMRFDSEFFRRYKIDITDCTPSIFSMFLMNNLDLGLKHLIIGGEILNRKIVEDFFDQFGKSSTRITNVYGPAECCVDSSLYEIDGNNMDFNESVPLGKPLSNQKIYILDERSKLKPIAIPGELCISGDNLGRGYLNLPEQTSEKFIRNPFYGDERLYRTGDLARWLYNGNIEFLGRIDQQVKIRGYRIELSEIECHLLQHPDIKESVVMVREDRDKGKYLCAYVVPNSDHLSSHELREHLSHKLPEYLIPAYFVQLDSLPLTASGKVDRRALPELESNFLLGEYAPPKNELERKLIEMWSQVLGVDGKTMGIDSNFFDLGGHSLNVIRLAARMQDIFKIRVPIMEIFRFPTIRGLSEYIARIKEKKDENESLSSKNRNPTKGGQV
jgi:bacitracin synthase 1